MTAFSHEWHALGREAELAAEHLALGVTALGRANHAHKGLYNQTFFALSVGFERLGKLVLVADRAIETGGSWLTDDELRSAGHDILALFDAAELIVRKRCASDSWAVRPALPIHSAIAVRLSEFAKRTRYYSLACLSGETATQMREPIEAW